MDIREQALVGMLAILETISGERTFRNEDDVSANRNVTTILFDGDENISDNPTTRNSRGDPRVLQDFMIMSPMIEIIISASTATVGTVLNDYRNQIILAMMDDASALISIVGPNGTIRYLGCSAETQSGEKSEGRMTIRFDLVYAFNVAELAS